jgi:hypothetical protein
MEWTSSCRCNLHGICTTFGSCLIMWSMLLVGQLWLIMCTILLIVKLWPLRFVTCSLGTPKVNKSCEQSIIRWWWRMSFQNQNLTNSWLIVLKPIWLLLELFMVLGILLLGLLIRNALVYSIGLSHLISTPNNWPNFSYKINTTFFATNTKCKILGGS